MANTQPNARVLRAFEIFLHQYPPQEVASMLRTLYFCYLREISESGFPENFHHESCLMEDLMEVFDMKGET